MECVVYELIKATFEAKQRNDGGRERERERIPEKQDGMRGIKENVNKNEMRGGQTEEKGEQETNKLAS